MNAGIDEILLTAYALGELSGTERATVAAHLVGNEAARQYVAEIRSTASLLSDELARESYGGLTDLQHAAIEQKLNQLPPRVARPRFNPFSITDRRVLYSGIAASVLIVGGIAAVLLQIMHSHGLTNRSQTPFVANNTSPGGLSGSGNNTQPSNPQESDNPFQRTPPVVKGNTDEDNFGPQEPLLPAPDDRLAMHGSDPQFSEPPVVSAVPPHADKVPTPPMVRIAKNGSPPDDKNTQPMLIHPRVHQPSADPFADIPPDQRAPGKVSVTVSPGAGAVSHGEEYAHLLENPFIKTASDPLSGFSAGVDTASYSNIRRFLSHGKLPPADAVRIEEMLNYFPVHRLPSPGLNEPAVAMQVGIAACPWKPDRRLARICVQGREIAPADRPAANLVFVIDISDSMRAEGRLPMLKQAMRLVVGKLSPKDHVAIVAYGRQAVVILAPTAVEDKQSLWATIDRLETLGQTSTLRSSAGEPGGLDMAYELAGEHFVKGAINRIILATDGGWNIGANGRAHLVDLVQRKSRDGVSLTVLGVGMKNLNDAMLQKLALAGAGSYAYIDTLAEARRVLVDQINGALIITARNVKVQVAFDPAVAESYRLIGYERRVLTNEQLASQSKRGGEMGAGQSVTALYEVIPSGHPSADQPADLLTATVTYVDAVTLEQQSIEVHAEDRATTFANASTEFRFAAAVAEFGLLLRNSDYKGNATYAAVVDCAQDVAGLDDTNYRQEFVNLVRKAKTLSTGR